MHPDGGSEEAAGLAPPPRRVPLSLQIVCLFGGVKGGCAWLSLFFATLGVAALLEALPDEATLGWSVFGLVLFSVLALVALLLVLTTLRDGLRERRLMVRGTFAAGRVIRVEPLAPRCSRLTFEVVDETGQRLEVQGTAYGDRPIDPQSSWRLLYDPARPDSTLLLDNGGADAPPQLDGRGGFRRASLPDAILDLVLVVLVLVVPVRAIVDLLIRAVLAHSRGKGSNDSEGGEASRR